MSVYKDNFDTLSIKSEKKSEVKYYVDKINKNKDIYQKVASQVDSRMPYWFVGVIHQMEAGGKFTTHIHNGDPLTARTVNVPKNRPANGNPPFTWEFSAIDGLTYESLNNGIWKRLKNDWSIDAILQKLEAWNGLGYKKKGVSNPYLWSYTNYYTSGKYVRDGVYDPDAISKQPGVAAIIKTLLEVTPDAATQTTGVTGSNPEQAISRGETNNSSQNSENSSKNNLTSSGLTNIFKTVLTPGEINIPTVDTDQTKNEIATGLGYIPLLWYNAYQIDVNDIRYLSLYDDGIAPALKVSFVDSLNLMRDKAFPLDDTKITIFINSRSEQLKPIFLQFKIRNFTNTNGLLSIDAIIDVNGLFIKKFQSYNSMTSNKTLQEVCKDLGLGFNTNIVDTNDAMTWINTGNKPYDFMLDVVEHSYISDEAFVYGYIDFYYNYNFVDIQKELSRNIEQEMGVVKLTMEEILNPVDKGLVSMLVLTNDASAVGSNIYFSSYRTINNSTSLSLEYGYRDVIKYYNTLDKSFLQFSIESLNNDSDKSIILKGSPQDTEFYSENSDYHYSGKIDHDNVHKNYNYSPTHNSRNINEISKIGLEVELNTPNFNIYKFQKIKVLLSNNTPTISADMVNQRLSGDWIIIDIKYVYDKQMKQVVTLVRRELSLSNEELDSEPSSASTNSLAENSRGTYTNPTDQTSTTSNNALASTTTSSGNCTRQASIELERSKTNIGHLKNAALQVGLTSKYAIASLIGIAGGESKWVPQEEAYKYSLSRIRQIFPKLTDDQYNRATRANITRKEFFEIVYGEYDPGRVGNRNVTDGGLYYGRGYIQLTGYGNYKRYAQITGIDIVSKPDLLNDPIKGAIIAAAYFKDRVKEKQDNPNYIEAALRAVGYNAPDIREKKLNYYNCSLNTV